MKKLIAIAVVFALVAGVAFAVDLGGSFIGTVDVMKGDSGKDSKGDANPVSAGASVNQIRIGGSGEVADGKFGGFFRFDGAHWSGEHKAFGHAWWKPIDQFKLLIGSNGGDGYYGTEGHTGWMFYQTVTDVGVTMGGDNVWGGSNYTTGVNTRHAFFGGDGGDNALRLEITPMDMLAININLPFFDGGEIGDVFMKVIAQVDLKFDFGNIALTYQGGRGYNEGTTTPDDWQPITVDGYDASGNKIKIPTGSFENKGGTKGAYDEPGSLFLYYGGSFGDLGIDFGLGYHLPKHGDNGGQPLGIGLGVRYGADAFGVKFRTVLSLPAEDDQGLKVLADILPSYKIADNIAAFVSFGLGISSPSKNAKDLDSSAEAITGWHFNPYLVVGEEWGAKFVAGVKLWSDGVKKGDDPAIVNWAVPIALIVSF
jgi:hypothetical protein